jgi:chromosome partitioning protein
MVMLSRRAGGAPSRKTTHTVLRVIVMNAKGGCGKTTVATNLASYAASAGHPTALFDYDPQGSSGRWLRNRPKECASVYGVSAFDNARSHVTRSFQLRVPTDTRLAIVDTPAGFSGINFEDRVSEADAILIPVLPSAIDIHSTADFIRDLLIKGKARSHHKPLGIVANRIRAHTKSLEKLERFLETLGIPVVARLRDTQRYVRAAEEGLGVHELAERQSASDTSPWPALLEWIGLAAAPTRTPGSAQGPSPLPSTADLFAED